MITVDITIAITVFLSACLVLVFSAWLFYNLNEDKKNTKLIEKIVACPYCAHLFKENRSELIRCPQCKSIIGINDNTGNEKKQPT